MLRKKVYPILLLFLAWALLHFSCDTEVRKREKIEAAEIATLRPLPAGHKQFILNIYPKIATANLEMEIKREAILSLGKNYQKVVLKGERLYWLKEIAAEFKFDDSLFSREMTENEFKQKIDTLLSRVDIIPENLVLAQAIVESGWGKSKFAKEANNYFGIRCYSPGCGVKPSESSDSTFWVKKYPTIESCIEEYIRTLNTGLAYNNLRRARQMLRKNNNFPNGVELAKRLMKYSESGGNYTNLLASIIKYYIPANLSAFVKYQGSAKMLEEDFFREE